MGLFDKLLGKQEKAKVPNKPLEELTDEEFLVAYDNADTYGDPVLFYRYNKDKLRRGMKIASPGQLGNMAFWGEYAGTKMEVDLKVAEVCARVLLQDSSNANRSVDKYILGYISMNSNKPSYCFVPDFDALEHDAPLILDMERKRYRKVKRELARDGKGLPDYGFDEAFLLDEIQNLRRIGYDKITFTPENVVKFFRELAEKGDPTGQYWYSICCDYEYQNSCSLKDGDKWCIKAAEQGYPLAVYNCNSANEARVSNFEQFEKIKREHHELLHLLDEYIEQVECTYPMESFGRFMAKKNAAFAEVQQKETDIAKAASLYQQGLAFFALGEQGKASETMLQSAQLGNLSAYEWLVKLSAEAGNALAQYQLGELYLAGTELTPKNPTMAFPWLVKAASGGIMDAYWRMGEMYRIGAYGFDRNDEMAAAMYWKGAEGNHKSSMLAYGDYAEPDEAKTLYRKLIALCADTLEDKNYKLEAYRKLSVVDPADGETSILAAAQFVLLYFDSNEKLGYTGKTPGEAVKAVFAGDADMAYKIGSTIAYGKQDCIDDSKKVAAVWWRLAADLYMDSALQGNIEAIKQLFYIYKDDLKDEGKAYYWGMKGLETGDAAMYYQVADNPKLFNLDHEEVIAYLEIAAQKGYEAAKEQLIWWHNQEKNERERQRKVQRILDEQEAQRRTRREWELSARLDNIERMSNALIYGEFYTDEERALMGKMSLTDSVRSANLRDEVMKSLMLNR